MNRRHFLFLPATLRLAAATPLVDVRAVDRERILRAADSYLKEKPITVTASHSPRSAGGPHDFFSEGDYWWPDPKNPKGPYIRRDGMTNPHNFDAHRHAMVRFSIQAPALVAAWLLTKEKKYVDHAALHYRAWFVDKDTLMNPNLQYAQAIHGRFTGRGIGIIDTLHLVEVARAAIFMEPTGALTKAEFAAVRRWFSEYVTWMTTHPYGIAERDAKNNHGSSWVAQVAQFSELTGDRETMSFCADRFKTVLVPDQIAPDGSFPLELARTKPYGYSLFNLDVLGIVCQILSRSDDSLWLFQLPDGRGMKKAMQFMFPYIKDKSTWPYKHDVMYYDDWPVRQPSLLFAGLAFGRRDYIDLWRKLDPDPKVEEIIRNFPLRQPVLWV